MARDIISSLPEDIVQNISVHADIADVFALKQTCRSLNRLTDSDYLWHQLLPREEIPLDLSPFLDFRSFGAPDLRASALRALKLRNNWSRKNPRVRGVYVANPCTPSYNGAFDEMKLLGGGTVLLGIRRERHSEKPYMIISAVNLTNVERPHMCAHLSIQAAMKDFDACLEHDEGTRLILAATVAKGGAEILEVYSMQLPLHSPAVCNGTYVLAYSFKLHDEGLFHKVSLHGCCLASSIIHRSFGMGDQSSRILIANWKTRQQLTITPRFTHNPDLLDIKLLPPYLAIVAASVETAQVAIVPLSIISNGSELEQPAVSVAKQDTLPQFPHITVPLMDFLDICISSNAGFGPYVPPTSLSLIVFPTLSRLDVRQSKKALHLRFAINSSPLTALTESSRSEANVPPTTCAGSDDATQSLIRLEKCTPFDIPVGSYPEYSHLGSTGRRGVWLEQSLKSDYVQLRRFDYDPLSNEPPSVSILLPPEPQLPFKPSSCRALAFDEATGRLCVGLYNGTAFVLDYV